MEQIPSVICDVAKCAAVPIRKRIDYVRNLSKNTKALKEQADSLLAKRVDFLGEIERLKFEKAPSEQGKKWLRDVEQIEQQLREMEDKYKAATAEGCGIRWCCNVRFRRKLGETVEEMIQQIQKLDANNVDDNFLVDLPPQRAPMVPIPSMKAETVVANILKELLKFLRDKNIRKIGIWGKGGIGKTTIMKALNNMQEVKGMFDLIIWVTVSNTWTVKMLQKEIANHLSLDVENKSEDYIARTLLEKLGGQKYLLLLDDAWEMVDLVKIGLPNASEGKGCKIVLTTREMQVCREMETDKEMELLPWPENEAWDMFCSKVGEVAMTPKIIGLAKRVVKECVGLPLALTVVAGMLRKEENVCVWQDILRGLKFPSTSNNIGMNEKVYDILKLSYDGIKDQKMKTCFLFCGLYQEDKMIKISELIRYWHGEGLLFTDGTLVESYNRGHCVIRDLVDKSLLERCNSKSHVKLHDLIRDMVLRMTSSSHGEQSKHLVINYWSPNPREPSLEDWENAKRISLTWAKLEDFPRNPNCSTLSILIIHRSEKIPEEFFAHMPELRVLDLSNSRITHLPVSVVSLVNLRSLLLRCCKSLRTLPKEVGAMKKLEMLWATETEMKYVPHEVFELPSLKFLKLTCWNDSSYPLKPLISGSGGGVKWRLKLLEVFVISNNLCRNMSDADVKVIAMELGMLRGLRSLRFDFLTLENFTEFIRIPWRSSRGQILTKFQICIDCDLGLYSGRGWKKCLSYDAGGAAAAGLGGGSNNNNNNNKNVNMLPDCISEVFACCDRFVLKNHGGVKFLPTLFSSLGVLHVYNCRRLKKMFSWRLIRHLTDLTELIIGNCDELEEIISDDEEDEEVEITADVGQVKEAAALQFESLCSSTNTKEASFSSSSLRWPSLEKIEIEKCSKLRRFPLNVDDAAALPKLRRLTLCKLPEFEWFGSSSTNTNTKEASSSSSSLRWPSLEVLYIIDCPKLRRLPFNNNNDDATLPKLVSLTLKKLPKFEWFCSSSTNTKEASSYSLRWPSLKEIDVGACPKLRRLPFNNNDDDDAAALPELRTLILRELPQFEWLCSTNTKATSSSSSSLCWPSLECVEISNCPKFRRFPFNVDDAATLRKLRYLALKELPEFEWFCSSSSSTNTKEASCSSSSLCWSFLEQLSISDCAKLTRFPFNNNDDNVILPKLTRLTLEELPEFEWFCSSNTNTKEASSSSLWCPSLEFVKIVYCPKFRRFPFNVNDAVALPRLRRLTLESLPEFEWFCSSSINTKEASSSSFSLCCPSLEDFEIVDCPKFRRFPFNVNDAVALPKLRRLTLGSLPEFEWLCSSSSSTNTKEAYSSSSSLCWPSLEYLFIDDCPKLRRLPFNNIDDDAPKLKTISGQQNWWEALEWDGDDCGAAAAKLRFHPSF